jgi:hypothetical protein
MALISGTVAAGFLVVILKALLPALTRLLTRVAVGKLPVCLRERYDEEWRSYLDEVPGQPQKSLAAAGFLATALRVSIREDYFSTKERFAETLAQVDMALKLLQAVVTHIPTMTSGLPDLPELAIHVNRVDASIEHVKYLMVDFRNRRNKIELMAKMKPLTYVIFRLFYKKRLDEFFVESNQMSAVAVATKKATLELVAELRAQNHPLAESIS